MLRYAPSIATLMGVFCHEWMLNLSNVCSVSVEMIMWFLSFLLLMLCITFIDFFLTFYFVLIYSQLTVLWQFPVNSEAIHTHVSILPSSPPIQATAQHWAEFHVLCRMSAIHFKHSSMYVSIPDSPTVRSSHPPPTTISSFSKSVSVFLFCDWVHLFDLFLYSAYKGCHMVSLLLCLTYFTQDDNL